jgi:regulator of protease activity HflC (stomatin/prohibitin superfamily)
VRVIQQSTVGIVQRMGRYQRTLGPGVHLLVPMLDRINANVDMKETVQAFPPQPVITQDNVTIGIDTVVYYQVTDAVKATYEVANVLVAMEQLTVTTLRNVVGSMTLEETLTSRDQINSQLRIVLDEATEKWGVRVTRVELKSIDPPRSIQEAMEQQMRADRAKRAAVLQAEGEKQAAILRAEGLRQAAILNAEADQKSNVLRAEGEKQARALRAEGGPRRSPGSSRPSRAPASRPRTCSATSISRRCRRSPTATRTSSSSCPRARPTRWAPWPGWDRPSPRAWRRRRSGPTGARRHLRAGHRPIPEPRMRCPAGRAGIACRMRASREGAHAPTAPARPGRIHGGDDAGVWRGARGG